MNWNIQLNNPQSYEAQLTSGSFLPNSDQNLAVTTLSSWVNALTVCIQVWILLLCLCSKLFCRFVKKSREYYSPQHFYFPSSNVLLSPASCAAVVGTWGFLCFATTSLSFWDTSWKMPRSVRYSSTQKRWQKGIIVHKYLGSQIL